jgi:hypothetical protein
MASSPLHGVIVGRLKELHPRWIVVGDLMLILDGEPCQYSIGTTLQVVYIEQDGHHVKSITPLPAAREMSDGPASSPPAG